MEKTELREAFKHEFIGNWDLGLNAEDAESFLNKCVEIASQFRTEGASTVPSEKDINKAAKKSCDGHQHAFRYQMMLEQFRLGAKWMREKMLKAKGARTVEDCGGSRIRENQELEELKAENERLTKQLLKETEKYGAAYFDLQHVKKELASLKTLQPNNTMSKEKVVEAILDEMPLFIKEVFKENEVDAQKQIIRKYVYKMADSVCSLPNAATSAEAVNKAINILEQIKKEAFIGNEDYDIFWNYADKALSLLKQSNHQ